MKYRVHNLYDLINYLMSADKKETSEISKAAEFDSLETANSFIDELAEYHNCGKHCFYVQEIK